jgi:pilus assembly protein Flp/PilA
MKNLFNRFAREDAGQDLIEYGLLVGVITVGTIVLVTAIGTKITGIFGAADTAIGTVPGA